MKFKIGFKDRKYVIRPNIILASLVTALIAVFLIDFPFHYLISSPQEEISYYLMKFAVYFLYSVIFFKFYKITKRSLIIASLIVSLVWGAYYNVLPSILGYSPYGIALTGISVLGRGVFVSGLLFGLIHMLAYYVGVRAAQKVVRV